MYKKRVKFWPQFLCWGDWQKLIPPGNPSNTNFYVRGDRQKLIFPRKSPETQIFCVGDKK